MRRYAVRLLAGAFIPWFVAAPASAHGPMAPPANLWAAWTADPYVLVPLVIAHWLYGRGVVFRETLIECLGTGASVRGIASRMSDTHLVETVLRVSVAADTQEPVSRFAREIASLVTSGPQGTTGYASGRPPVLPVFGYWPCRMGRDQLQPAWTFL